MMQRLSSYAVATALFAVAALALPTCYLARRVLNGKVRP